MIRLTKLHVKMNPQFFENSSMKLRSAGWVEFAFEGRLESGDARPVALTAYGPFQHTKGGVEYQWTAAGRREATEVGDPVPEVEIEFVAAKTGK